MKTFKRFFVLTLLAVAMALPASAQFRWGPKVGIEVNKMHFNKELGNSDNQTGFTGGLMAEIQVPIIGICVDGSFEQEKSGWRKEVQCGMELRSGCRITQPSADWRKL